MATVNFEDVLEAIRYDGYSDDQINDIYQACKYAKGRLAARKILDLRVGQTVSFTGRRGRTETGTVIHIAVKKAQVKCGAVTWTVPANMLTLV